MRLLFIGSGDAFGTGGRFNTCFLAEHAAGAFLIDCGATSMVAMRQRGVEPNAIRTIFITHLHGDHFGGLPFFLMDARYVSRRETPLTIAGPAGLRERLEALTEALYPGMTQKALGFDLAFVELAAGRSDVVDGVGVLAMEMNHESGAPSLGLRLAVDGRTIAYTGDTGWADAVYELGREADLYILESTYFAPSDHHAHLDYTQLHATIGRANARRVVLTHFGPEMMANRHLAELELAEDGKAIEL